MKVIKDINHICHYHVNDMIFKYIRHLSIYKSKIDLNHKLYLKFKNKLTYNSL